MPDDQPLSPDRLKELLGQIDPEVLQQVMPPTGGVIAMMFTDIVDSTEINAEVGDQVYFQQILEPHNRLIRACIPSKGARELKTIGDSFFIGFASLSLAVACGTAIQQKLTAESISVGNNTLRVRIGIHTGEPVVYRDLNSGRIDLSGSDVNKAARVKEAANGGQVLISEETKTLAKPKEFHDWGLWELKGLGRHRIIEVLWPGKKPERPIGRSWLEPIRFPTSFIGREKELAQITEAVKNHRLVTLKGMGGIGKTRLADEAAARVSQEFGDGVFFVELAYSRDSEQSVISELVAKLDVKLTGFPDEATALLTTLQNRRMLLVLDNFEVVMSAAPSIGRLLKGCPGLHILITSQAYLGLGGEKQIPVDPMGTPPASITFTPEALTELDSFKLFCDRARLKKPDWDTTPADAPIVADILDLTDGIPLSIELAASWVDRIALAELRDGLRKNRSQYLKRSGPAIEEKRHASMQACIDWSFNLLSPSEKELLTELSAFVGGFFAEDVAEVCRVKNASALLDSLQGHSLLMWEGFLDKTRYRMLPTTREYAAKRLKGNGNQAEELRQRHAQHFLEVLDRADDQIRGKEQMVGINRITADIENIRAGMDTVVQTHDHQTVVRYSQAFGYYLAIKSRFAERLMRAQQSLSAAEELKDSQLIAGCQNNLGNAYQNLPTGDRGENLKKAIACYEAALRVRTERDFPVDWAMTQNNLGGAYSELPTGDRGENLKKAIACYEAAIRGYEAAGLSDEANRIRRYLASLKDQG
ncbi:MAG: tetratricopeptide repeat protein [Deltaproteobacteria bacterium]|nr:tetratricopeptide repeat protein [Deltaproteobacteria bacterium]